MIYQKMLTELTEAVIRGDHDIIKDLLINNDPTENYNQAIRFASDYQSIFMLYKAGADLGTFGEPLRKAFDRFDLQSIELIIRTDSFIVPADHEILSRIVQHKQITGQIKKMIFDKVSPEFLILFMNNPTDYLEEFLDHWDNSISPTTTMINYINWDSVIRKVIRIGNLRLYLRIRKFTLFNVSFYEELRYPMSVDILDNFIAEGVYPDESAILGLMTHREIRILDLIYSSNSIVLPVLGPRFRKFIGSETCLHQFSKIFIRSKYHFDTKIVYKILGKHINPKNIDLLVSCSHDKISLPYFLANYDPLKESDSCPDHWTVSEVEIIEQYYPDYLQILARKSESWSIRINNIMTSSPKMIVKKRSKKRLSDITIKFFKDC